MKIIILSIILSISAFSKSKGIIKIEIGGDYHNYSTNDLKKRIWNLERAVWQLQQRVFNLEVSESISQTRETWICKMSAMGINFSATGPNKAIAESKVLDKCKSGDNPFFCNKSQCSK